MCRYVYHHVYTVLKSPGVNDPCMSVAVGNSENEPDVAKKGSRIPRWIEYDNGIEDLSNLFR